MTQDKLSEDELDTLEACLRNGQPGRIMPYEIGQLIAGYRELLALRSATPMPEPVAWQHRLIHSEGYDFDWELTEAEQHPFRDFDPAYTVISQPLYTAPPAREISEAEVERVRSVIRYLNHPETPWSDDQIKAVIEAARSPS
jgi:hypothetical protein